MAEFYDHPVTGKLFFRAPAGGGNSVYDGPATESDVKIFAQDHDRYCIGKLAAARKADADRSDTDALAALKSETAEIEQQVAEVEAHHNKEAE
jgi:hypothetical protein